MNYMPNIAPASYYDEQQDLTNPYNQLVIEISKNHLVCMLLKDNNQTIIGFEYLPIDNLQSNDLKENLENAMSNSQLLNKGFKNPHIFFNHEQCLPVPASKFEEELADDYLNTIYGEDYESAVYHEQLPIMPGFIFVFRIQQNVSEWLIQKFHQASFHHTYTRVTKQLLDHTVDLTDHLISVKFYHTFFIAIVIKNGELILIQTYEFEGIGDVLYALLNLVKQFELNQETVTVQLSGIIEPLSVWEQVKQHFNHVVADEISNPAFTVVSTGHPLYYFSPFINLVS